MTIQRQFDNLPSIADIAHLAYGDQVRVVGSDLLCPCHLHPDTHPSLRIKPVSNVWYCHVCGVGGGVLSFRDAMIGLGLVASPDHPVLQRSAQNRTKPATSARNSTPPKWPSEVDWTGLTQHLSDDACHAWVARGVSVDTIRQSGAIEFVAFDTPCLAWKMIGKWGPSRPVGVRVRPIDPSRLGKSWPRDKDGKPKKSVAAPNSKLGLLATDDIVKKLTLHTDRQLWVCEGEADWLCALERGLCAVATPGTPTTEFVLDALALLATKAKSVVLAMDRPKSWVGAAPEVKWVERLVGRLANIETKRGEKG